MTGFAVARPRRPQTLKCLDGLFDGLNPIAEHSNCAPDASSFAETSGLVEQQLRLGQRRERAPDVAPPESSSTR